MHVFSINYLEFSYCGSHITFHLLCAAKNQGVTLYCRVLMSLGLLLNSFIPLSMPIPIIQCFLEYFPIPLALL
jgi:hypothetical protein